MGTIINDFFYRDKYETHFDRAVNRYIEENITGLKQISDLSLIEEYFTGLLDFLLDFDKYNRRVSYGKIRLVDLEKEESKLVKEIKTLNEADEGATNKLLDKGCPKRVVNLLAHTKNEKINRIYDINEDKISTRQEIEAEEFKLDAMRDIIIALYEKLNEVYSSMTLNGLRIGICYVDLDKLKEEFAKEIGDKETVDYLANQVYETIINEIDYLIEAFKTIYKINGDNLTEDNVRDLREDKKRLDNIKKVLRIKKELLADCYFRMCYTESKIPKIPGVRLYDNKVLIGAATEYIEFMLDGKTDNLYSKVSSINNTIEDKTSVTISNPFVSELRRELQGVCKSHIGGVRVLK